jgi:hypothetical protein
MEVFMGFCGSDQERRSYRPRDTNSEIKVSINQKIYNLQWIQPLYAVLDANISPEARHRWMRQRDSGVHVVADLRSTYPTQKDFRNTINIMTTDTPMPDVESTVSYPQLILPGEILSTILSQPLKLGPGLRHSTSANGDTLIQATQAGLLHRTKHSEFYVDYNSHRVRPSPNHKHPV